MADVKKYLSLERLSEYDALLKAKIAQDDAVTLDAAKEYADGLIENVNTSIDNITKGDVIVKEAEHAVSADSATSATTADSATVAESATKATQDGNGAVIADTYETKADASAKLDEAKEYTDALKEYVGTIPEGATATDIVGYVQEKTSGIASEGAMTELSNRVGIVEGKVATIEGDYLKAADKTELQGNIDTVSAAVELLTNGVDAETVDGVNDLIAYVNEHGTEVTGMKADIKANADALAGLAEVAKTGSWNDLVDRPFGEEGSRVIIEWDGNTEGLPVVPMGDGFELHKISDLTPSKEDFYGTVQTGPDGKGAEISESGEGMTQLADGFLHAGFLYVVTASEVTFNGVTLNFPSHGIYTLNYNGETQFSYTEIGSLTVHKLDEKFIPDTIARTADLTALESSLNATISGKAAQGDLDSAVERLDVLEAWHEGFEEISTEDINGLFA